MATAPGPRMPCNPPRHSPHVHGCRGPLGLGELPDYGPPQRAIAAHHQYALRCLARHCSGPVVQQRRGDGKGVTFSSDLFHASNRALCCIRYSPRSWPGAGRLPVEMPPRGRPRGRQRLLASPSTALSCLRPCDTRPSHARVMSYSRPPQRVPRRSSTLLPCCSAVPCAGARHRPRHRDPPCATYEVLPPPRTRLAPPCKPCTWP